MNDNKAEYVPNEIPVGTRIRNAWLSVVMIIWGAHGLWTNQISYHPRRFRGLFGSEEIVFRDLPLILIVIAMTLLSAHLISEIVDHYDKRDNEVAYQRFGRVCFWSGVIAFVLSLLAKHWGYGS